MNNVEYTVIRTVVELGNVRLTGRGRIENIVRNSVQRPVEKFNHLKSIVRFIDERYER